MARKRSRKKGKKAPMFFSAWNYKILGIGLLMVVIGFIAMYLENEVKGFVSLYISPLLIIGGYATVVYAIMEHDRDEVSNSRQTT